MNTQSVVEETAAEELHARETESASASVPACLRNTAADEGCAYPQPPAGLAEQPAPAPQTPIRFTELAPRGALPVGFGLPIYAHSADLSRSDPTFGLAAR
jgi:hypothetical protein